MTFFTIKGHTTFVHGTPDKKPQTGLNAQTFRSGVAQVLEKGAPRPALNDEELVEHAAAILKHHFARARVEVRFVLDAKPDGKIVLGSYLKNDAAPIKAPLRVHIPKPLTELFGENNIRFVDLESGLARALAVIHSGNRDDITQYQIPKQREK